MERARPGHDQGGRIGPSGAEQQRARPGQLILERSKVYLACDLRGGKADLGSKPASVSIEQPTHDLTRSRASQPGREGGEGENAGQLQPAGPAPARERPNPSPSISPVSKVGTERYLLSILLSPYRTWMDGWDGFHGQPLHLFRDWASFLGGFVRAGGQYLRSRVRAHSRTLATPRPRYGRSRGRRERSPSSPYDPVGSVEDGNEAAISKDIHTMTARLETWRGRGTTVPISVSTNPPPLPYGECLPRVGGGRAEVGILEGWWRL